jgi:hypothetical protein
MEPSTTSSCHSCRHAARTWLCWPPGPSSQGYLSSSHLEAYSAMTFRACSSHVPTLVKPQPAMQYLAKNQSTPRCQSLITLGSDHPSVLEPHRLSLRSEGTHHTRSWHPITMPLLLVQVYLRARSQGTCWKHLVDLVCTSSHHGPSNLSLDS